MNWRCMVAAAAAMSLASCYTAPSVPPHAGAAAAPMTSLPLPPAPEPPWPPAPALLGDVPGQPAEPDRDSLDRSPVFGHRLPLRPHPEPVAPLRSAGMLPVDSPQWHHHYDGLFRAASRTYWSPLVDWRWWRAMAIVESSLRPCARSSAGAVGLMQIMPDAWGEVAPLVRATDPCFPPDSVRAGVYYARILWDLWPDIPEWRQRIAFVLASYNAGTGRIRAGLRHCRSRCDQWAAVARHAPEETRRYVERIMRLMGL